MIMSYIAFRVDATSQIGTGHFMRCLTLADALKQRGVQICFVSRGLPSHLCDMLTNKNISLLSLDSNASSPTIDNDLVHSHWLGVSQAQDAQETIQALSDQSWDWLVVDHYALDTRWENVLRATVKKIMVIDDIADRSHDCDVLLDQNFYTDMQTRYIDKVPPHCQLLLGPHYALLRDEFRKLREQVKPRTGTVNRILVFFGGVDADNYTARTIDVLSQIGISGLQVDVVIGTQHPCRIEIETRCAELGYICHVQTNHMAELMAVADLAIGAGGSAVWERCCLGVPTLSICVASNQHEQIVDAAQNGLLYALLSGDLVNAIKIHVMALFENESLRQLISNIAMKIVDGRGTIRIANILSMSEIKIRPANKNDSPKLFEWRNHAAIRAVSRNQDLITWEEHQSWFIESMNDKDRILLIGYIGDDTVGVVRFDKQADFAEVSIYLVPDGGHTGKGRNLLSSAEQWLKVNRPDIKHILATVLGKNEPSQKLFSGAHYSIDTVRYLKEL